MDNRDCECDKVVRVCACFKRLALLRMHHSGEITLAGTRRLRCALAAASVLFAHTCCHNNNTILIKGGYSTYFTKSNSVHTLKGLAVPRAWDSGAIAQGGPPRLHSTLAAAPVLFAHAVVTEIKNK